MPKSRRERREFSLDMHRSLIDLNINAPPFNPLYNRSQSYQNNSQTNNMNSENNQSENYTIQGVFKVPEGTNLAIPSSNIDSVLAVCNAVDQLQVGENVTQSSELLKVAQDLDTKLGEEDATYKPTYDHDNNSNNENPTCSKSPLKLSPEKSSNLFLNSKYSSSSKGKKNKNQKAKKNNSEKGVQLPPKGMIGMNEVRGKELIEVIRDNTTEDDLDGQNKDGSICCPSEEDIDFNDRDEIQSEEEETLQELAASVKRRAINLKQTIQLSPDIPNSATTHFNEQIDKLRLSSDDIDNNTSSCSRPDGEIYELLCKVVANQNNMMRDIKENTERIENIERTIIESRKIQDETESKINAILSSSMTQLHNIDSMDSKINSLVALIQDQEIRSRGQISSTYTASTTGSGMKAVDKINPTIQNIYLELFSEEFYNQNKDFFNHLSSNNMTGYSMLLNYPFLSKVGMKAEMKRDAHPVMLADVGLFVEVITEGLSKMKENSNLPKSILKQSSCIEDGPNISKNTLSERSGQLTRQQKLAQRNALISAELKNRGKK